MAIFDAIKDLFQAILYGIEPNKITLSSPPEAKVTRDDHEGKEKPGTRRYRFTLAFFPLDLGESEPDGK